MCLIQLILSCDLWLIQWPHKFCEYCLNLLQCGVDSTVFAKPCVLNSHVSVLFIWFHYKILDVSMQQKPVIPTSEEYLRAWNWWDINEIIETINSGDKSVIVWRDIARRTLKLTKVIPLHKKTTLPQRIIINWSVFLPSISTLFEEIVLIKLTDEQLMNRVISALAQ